MQKKADTDELQFDPAYEALLEEMGDALIKNTPGVYTEEELQDIDRISKSMPVEAAPEPEPAEESPSVLPALTVHQRKVARAVAKHGGNQTKAAQSLGVSRQAVNATINRAWKRVESARQIWTFFMLIEEEREPDVWIWRLWWSELAWKDRLTYRKKTRPLRSGGLTKRRIPESDKSRL